MACGDAGSTNAAAEKSVASAGNSARATGSAGKAGSSMAPVSRTTGATSAAGSRSVDTSVPDSDSDDDAGTAGAGGAAGRASVSVSGSGGASGAAGNVAVAGAGGSDAGMPGATVKLTGRVIEVQANGNFTPYGGAEVCVLDAMPPVCATADASGMLVIQMPANARTGLTMNLPGLFPMLTPITTGATDLDLSGRGEWSNYGAAVVLAEGTRNAATSMLKTTLDPAKGQADMIVFGLGRGTVTLEGTPAELKWFSSGGQFTVTDDAAPLGSVLHGFTNIEPGMRTFRAELNGQPCKFDPMIWAGAEPGTVTVPIRAGWWTRMLEVRCN